MNAETNAAERFSTISTIIKITAVSILSVISVILISSLLTVLIYGGNARHIPTSAAAKDFGIIDCFDDFTTNAISNAAEGFLEIKKVYKLNDHNQVAPEPDPDAFFTTNEPVVLEPVLECISPRLNGEPFFFQTDTEILTGSEIAYYLDETIFTVSWKQVINHVVYTFSEVKIEHPTQFRRFLADGQFGSEKQYLTSQMASSVNAVVASAGDFYKYRKQGIVVYNNQTERFNQNDLDSCFIDNNGDLIFSPAHQFQTKEELDQYVKENNIRFSLCFGPILIENGESRVPNRYPVGEINDYFSRAAICQLGPLHYLLVTVNDEGPYRNFPSLPMLTKELLSMGIQKAYTLDGGQTATIYTNNRVFNRVSYGAERYISDIIYFATALPGKSK